MKAVVHVSTLHPFLEFQTYPEIEERGHLCFPNKTKQTNYEEVRNLTLIFEPVGVPVCTAPAVPRRDTNHTPPLLIRSSAPVCILHPLLSSSFRPGPQRYPEESAQTAAALQRVLGAHIARGFCLFGGLARVFSRWGRWRAPSIYLFVLPG